MAKGRENQPHIGIFGRRNVGKSSLINAIVNQDISIVSDFAGTTTDPVKKSFEIPGIGPCVLIDTAGIDDVGDIGIRRIEKTMKVIDIIDLAVLVIEAENFGEFEIDLITRFNDYDIPFLIVHNKSDIFELKVDFIEHIAQAYQKKIIEFSTINKINLEFLLENLRKTLPESIFHKPKLLGDLIKYGDIVLLITPIDAEAPEGRLILPQVQTIRDILDNDAIAVVMKEREVDVFLKNNNIKPALVVTDSSFFLKADASIPKDIPLTGFSVLLARFKGDFEAYLEGTPKIDELKDGDRILVLESCSHHVSCDDIARVKLPRWLSSYTGKQLEYDIVAGLDKLPRPIEDYAILIQCGGCVVTKRQLQSRLKPAKHKGIPITNYGMTIAYIQGIYKRAIQPFLKTEISSDDYI